MRFVITRPRPDGETTAKKLEELGHEALLSPVMEVVCQPDIALPDPATLKGLIITSRNALRCLAQKAGIDPLSPSVWQDRTLFAVGKATGRQALDLGFKTIIYGNGRASALPDFIKGFNPHFDPQNNLPFYYPVGAKKAFDLAPVLRQQGFLLTEQVIYETVQTNQLAPAVKKGLEAHTIDGVLLLSPRSARLFGDLVKKNGLAQKLSTVACLCLSANVATATKDLPWQKTLIAPHPDMNQLLAQIEQLTLG
ncbi:MAG: uroporphyrinogen-III synthase [Hyphomicrobiaceae bacterium]|nr:uroporphyrinogen-III synthase [Hyphomicrobiaceae bacterium]